jgi:hypothetical protein
MIQTLSLPARDETVEFDRDVLSELCRLHGTGTEAVLTARLTELGRLLDLAEYQLAQGGGRPLARTCEALMRLADEIGMRTMTRAAGSVRATLERGDVAAMAACGARMLRLGRPASMGRWTVRRDTVA